MSEVIIQLSEPKTDAEYEAAFKQMLAEIERLNRQMEHDRKEIERLKTESDRLKADTRAILARLGVSI